VTITYEYSNIVAIICLSLLTIATVFLFFSNWKNAFSPYLILVLLFTGTAYGVEQGRQGSELLSILYTRGNGIFYLSLMNIFLILLFILTFAISRTEQKTKSPINFPNIFISILCAFIIIYYMYGMAQSLDLGNIISQYGAINIINMLLLIKILSWSINKQNQLDKFLKIFLYPTVLMGIYGLIRYVLFGGDPANAYKVDEGRNVNITFFDNGQSVLFSVVFAYYYMKGKISKLTPRMFQYLIMAICLANIILSYRRNAWFGLSFVVLWLFFISNFRRKIMILSISVILLLAVSTVYSVRFNPEKNIHKKAGILSDVTSSSGEFDLSKGRFSELYFAVKKASVSPLIGLGPWGINSPRITARDYDFVHSSIAHIYIKLGIVGVFLYVSIFMSYIIGWLKRRKQPWHSLKNKILADAVFCGFLCEIPDLFFGSPIIIYRHCQILAILLAIPFLCRNIDKHNTVNHERDYAKDTYTNSLHSVAKCKEI